LRFEDLDDGYYYILSSIENQDFALTQVKKIVRDFIMIGRGLPKRPGVVMVEDDFPSNKFLVIWEFGVIGEVAIQAKFDS